MTGAVAAGEAGLVAAPELVSGVVTAAASAAFVANGRSEKREKMENGIIVFRIRLRIQNQ